MVFTLSLYCTISIDSASHTSQDLWSGPNFGRCHMSLWLWSHVRNGSQKKIKFSWFKNLFTSALDTIIICKIFNTNWRHWKKVLLYNRNSKILVENSPKFCLSQFTLQVAQMLKCNHCVTGHTPGWINRNGTVLPNFIWHLSLHRSSMCRVCTYGLLVGTLTTISHFIIPTYWTGG